MSMSASFDGFAVVENALSTVGVRAPFSSPRGQSAQRSLRQQAPFSSLKACHQAVASLQRARGLFLGWVAGVHVQQSLFFAFGSLSESFRQARKGS